RCRTCPPSRRAWPEGGARGMSSIVKLPLPARSLAAVPEFRPRLLVIGVDYGPDTMEWHVVDAARAMGCTVEFFGARPFGAFSGHWRKALQKAGTLLMREPERLVERRLAAAVDDFGPELILVVLGSQLSPKTVAMLRTRTAAPI